MGDLLMKKLKTFLLITFCFALLLGTFHIPYDYEIAPYDHFENDANVL